MPRAPTVGSLAAFCGILRRAVGPADTSPPAQAAAAKTVLIIRGGSPDLPGGRIIVDAIEASVLKTSPSPVEIFSETIDTGRFSGEKYQRRVADLLAEKYSGRRVDLVVALSEPAMQFVLRERALFPGAALLLGLIEPRSFRRPCCRATSARYTCGWARPRACGSPCRCCPSTRRALVVGGTARSDVAGCGSCAKIWARSPAA